jgi:tellurium resistance protein TerD
MKRGANVALTKEVPGLTTIVLGVAWNVGAEKVIDDALVVATLLCDLGGKVLSDEHFVFFNQLTSPEESVEQRDTALGPDSEQVEITLGQVPAAVERIVLALYLNDGLGARRTLGQLKSCTIRVLNGDANTELVKSEDLAPGFGSETAVLLGEVYRNSGGWKFKVLGQGYESGIVGIAKDYGVNL